MSAQETKSTKELLSQQEWELSLNIGKNTTIIEKYNFTPTEIIHYSMYGNKELKLVFKYYLSDKIETTFNYDKVNKINNGKYIIIMNQFSDIIVYEIIKINKSVFEFSIVDTKVSQSLTTKSSKIQSTFKCEAKPK